MRTCEAHSGEFGHSLGTVSPRGAEADFSDLAAEARYAATTKLNRNAVQEQGLHSIIRLPSRHSHERCDLNSIESLASVGGTLQ